MKQGMAALLRDLLSRITSGAEVETIDEFLGEEAVADHKALQAVSTLKQIRLLLSRDASNGIDSRQGEHSGLHSTRPQLTRVRYEHLSMSRPSNRTDQLQTAIYKTSSSRGNTKSHVLLEWKRVDTGVAQQVGRRVMSLALLLSTASDESFHALKCLGYVQKATSGSEVSYAYVFELVDLLQTPSIKTPLRVLSLSAIMQLPQKPSLTERISMCLSVAENVLQLHTAGWLHKGICAKNVLFIDGEGLGLARPRWKGPYVAGYDFTRNTLEETETMPLDDNQILYRHPKFFESRSTYRKEYDLHAPGCVLLEIVLWQGLEDILEETDSASVQAIATSNGVRSQDQQAYERRKRLMHNKKALEAKATAQPIMDRVAFAGGDQIRQAIEWCFFPGLETDDESDISKEIEISVDTQLAIVNAIRSLQKL